MNNDNPPDSPPPPKPMTILVAEDDEILLTLLSRFLRQNGYTPIDTENGAEAVRMFMEHTPDLVLLDANMPVMDGFQACVQIKKSINGAKTPVIMVTALADDGSVDRAFEAGAEEYVTKPIHWAVLRQRIRLLIERRRAEEKIYFQAHFDSLTKLPNRSLFMDRLKQSLKLSRRNKQILSLLFIDLDRFKWVNDNMGHSAGDQLLQEAAARLTACVRQSDTIARLGGDEFTAILPNTNYPLDPEVVAKKIIKSLSRPFELEEGTASISASIGITAYPHDAEEMNILLRNADHAMYIAKGKGRNTYWFFTPDNNET